MFFENAPQRIYGVRTQRITLQDKIEVREFFANRQFILETIPQEEKDAFKMYYGLTDKGFMSLRLIANEMNCDLDSVVRYLDRARRRLCRPKRIEPLELGIEDDDLKLEIDDNERKSVEENNKKTFLDLMQSFYIQKRQKEEIKDLIIK